VGIRITGDSGNPGRPEVQLGRTAGAEAGFEQRIARDGVQVLAHGALVCPSCAMPLAVHGQLPAGSPLSCGFCFHTARTQDFLVRDVFDTLANEAQLVARIVA
jgi:hypothetical protein